MYKCAAKGIEFARFGHRFFSFFFIKFWNCSDNVVYFVFHFIE